MLLYNITINIEDDCREEWLQWVKEIYIPAIKSTRLLLDCGLMELLTGEKSSGTTYTIQLFFQKESDISLYEEQFLDLHQDLHYSKFGGKFVEFRSLLKTVE